MNGRRNKKQGGAPGFRGQPVIMLLLILLGWTGLRIATFEPPLFEQGFHFANSNPILGEGSAASIDPAGQIQRDRVQAPTPITGADRPTPEIEQDWQLPVLPQPIPGAGPLPSLPAYRDLDGDLGADAAPALTRNTAPVPGRLAVSHNLLLAAGLSGLPVPPVLQAYIDRATGRPAQAAAAPRAAPQIAGLASASGPRRLGMDAWVMWRDDSTTPLLSGRPSYGRSQMGAVVRYDLARANSHRPQVYARASAALAGADEAEMAAGFSARPVARLPLRAAAEMRFGENAAGTEARPAVYAVTEIPPVPLPARARGEIYLQGGYVGGTFATAFVDGQARIDRPVGSVAGADLRAGAGAWGGAQKGSARLDVGPTASLGFDMGEARGRLAADYRVRVAGNAQPASGPALTLSAGF